MEENFIINHFEDGYDLHELQYEEYAEDYCENVLEIPLEKVEAISIIETQMEITLQHMNYEDYKEDWYVNLSRISSNNNI